MRPARCTYKLVSPHPPFHPFPHPHPQTHTPNIALIHPHLHPPMCDLMVTTQGWMSISVTKLSSNYLQLCNLPPSLMRNAAMIRSAPQTKATQIAILCGMGKYFRDRPCVSLSLQGVHFQDLTAKPTAGRLWIATLRDCTFLRQSLVAVVLLGFCHPRWLKIFTANLCHHCFDFGA